MGRNQISGSYRMKPYFSIIIASRHRTQYLIETITNISLTASNKDNYEIILIIDDDDVDTLLTAKELKQSNLHIHIRPRGNNFVEHYLNWSYQFCKGKYIMPLGDDVLFKSYGWDINSYIKLEKFLEGRNDGFVLGITMDGIPNHEKQGPEWGLPCACSFPIISRAGIDTLGFILDPHFYDESADLSILLTYNNIRRLLDLRNVFIALHMPIEYTRKFGTPYHYKLIKEPYKVISSIERNGKTEENAFINSEKLKKFI